MEIPATFTTCKEQQTRCGKCPGTRREQLVICVSDHMVSTSVLVDCHTERSLTKGSQSPASIRGANNLVSPKPTAPYNFCI